MVVNKKEKREKSDREEENSVTIGIAQVERRGKKQEP